MCKDIGLVLFEKYPYLCPSSHTIPECICCELGVAKIKYPFKIVNEKPAPENYPHLAVANHNRKRDQAKTKYKLLFSNTTYYSVLSKLFNDEVWSEIAAKMTCG